MFQVISGCILTRNIPHHVFLLFSCSSAQYFVIEILAKNVVTISLSVYAKPDDILVVTMYLINMVTVAGL